MRNKLGVITTITLLFGMVAYQLIFKKVHAQNYGPRFSIYNCETIDKGVLREIHVCELYDAKAKKHFVIAVDVSGWSESISMSPEEE